jgi:hypothetical protein
MLTRQALLPWANKLNLASTSNPMRETEPDETMAKAVDGEEDGDADEEFEEDDDDEQTRKKSVLRPDRLFAGHQKRRKPIVRITREAVEQSPEPLAPVRSSSHSPGSAIVAATDNKESDEYEQALMKRMQLLQIVGERKAGATLAQAINKVRGPAIKDGGEEEEDQGGVATRKSLWRQLYGTFEAIGDVRIPSAIASTATVVIAVGVVGAALGGTLILLKKLGN